VEYRLGEVETASGDELVLPMANGVVELLIDGITCGKCIWPPYRFKLENCIGRHSLSLKCYNSLANQFERYAAPSGLAATPELKYYDEVKQITNNKNTE
jgi:hypothetical protein